MTTGRSATTERPCCRMG